MAPIVPSCQGSFDYVVARFATANSAQDDRAVEAEEQPAKQNVPDSFESWDAKSISPPPSAAQSGD